MYIKIVQGCDLLLSGGMSLDPDDVTRQGIRKAGAAALPENYRRHSPSSLIAAERGFLILK